MGYLSSPVDHAAMRAQRSAVDALNSQFTAQGMLGGSNRLSSMSRQSAGMPGSLQQSNGLDGLLSSMYAQYSPPLPARKPLYTVWRPSHEDADYVRHAEDLVGRIDFWLQIPIIGKWRASKIAEQLDTLTGQVERRLRYTGLVIADASADHPQA